MKRSTLGPWIALTFGALYFIVPLVVTFEFSLRKRRGEYSFDAYQAVLRTDEKGCLDPLLVKDRLRQSR